MGHFIRGDIIGFDTETTGLNVWHGDKPFAFSFSNEYDDTAYFEFQVDPIYRQPIIGKRENKILRMIAGVLEDQRIVKVMHNAKFDVRMMERSYKIDVAGPGGKLKDGGKFHDTYIMAFVCNTLEPSLKLKLLTKKYCNIGSEDQTLLHKATVRLRRRAAKLGWKIAYAYQERPDGTTVRKAQVAADYWLAGTMARRGILPDELGDAAEYCEMYAVKDAQRTLMLYFLYKDLIGEMDLKYAYQKLELDLWPVIYSMEDRGVATNIPKLEEQMIASAKVMKVIYPRLEKAAWPGFNPKKDVQVRELFYKKLGFAITKMTKGGKYGTKKQPAVDKFVIQAHIENPVVRDLAIWKANYTAFTTFFAKFKRLSIPDLQYGCTALHCDYRQVGPATGRLSSATPNLQNVMTPENTMAVHPIHVRPAFIPRDGYRWVCIDYEGMEVYVYAQISDEPTMMRAIKAGRNIHDEMTNTIWGGDNNEEAVKQAVRALSLDGTGMHTSREVDVLWSEWGITDKNLYSLSEKRKHDFAYEWLKSWSFDQVKAQSSIGRKNSKTTIKSLTFLKIYGGGAEKATLLLKVSIEEAARTLKLYDVKFPTIREYNRRLISEGKQNGFITSMWGRRLEIDPDKAYRAVNYMVQGSSADLMKRSLIRIHKWLRQDELDAHVLMTIHDEIVIEVHEDQLTRPFIRKACDIMCDVEGHLPMRMAVEPKVVVENWSIKKKVTYASATNS